MIAPHRLWQWRGLITRVDTPRAADIGITVLHALLKFAMLRGKLAINIAAGIPNLYKGGQRAEIVWTEAEIDRFNDAALLLGKTYTSALRC